MIPVPFWVAVVLGILGVIFWIAEQPRKARRRQQAREARGQLKKDLTAPPPAANLPYGFDDGPGPQ